MPRVQALNRNRRASMDWTATNRDRFLAAARKVKELAAEQYKAAKGGSKKPAPA